MPDLEAKLAGLQTPRGWGLFLIGNMVDECETAATSTTTPSSWSCTGRRRQMPASEYEAEVRAARRHRGDRPAAARSTATPTRPWTPPTSAAVRGDARTVVLDFADVDYINSTGIALIVGLLAKARRSTATVRAFGLSEHYRRDLRHHPAQRLHGDLRRRGQRGHRHCLHLNPPVQHTGRAMNDRGSLITDVRELSSRASVIDI